MFVYHILLPLRLGWLMVLSLYKEDYFQFFNVCSFDYTGASVIGKIGYQ